MRAVVQRVSEARVEIEGAVAGKINHGLLVLLGIEHADTTEDADWLAQKIVQMRIFNDADGKMNLSLLETAGEILVVSQFTLHAKTKKGNRPSFIQAARPEMAVPLYEYFKDVLSKLVGKSVESGEFGAMMQVSLVNDGPVTIFMDSRNRE